MYIFRSTVDHSADDLVNLFWGLAIFEEIGAFKFVCR